LKASRQPDIDKNPPTADQTAVSSIVFQIGKFQHYQPTSATREYVFSLPLFDEVDTEVCLFIMLSKYAPLIVSWASLSELSSRSFMAVLRKKAPKVVTSVEPIITMTYFPEMSKAE
jgi:hypothetical protein